MSDKKLKSTVVTMCKDCVHFKSKGYDTLVNKQFGVCDRHSDFWYEGDEVLENDFCSFAEKLGG